MQKFVTVIANMMKANRLYASQGGPIILSQVDLMTGLHHVVFIDDLMYTAFSAKFFTVTADRKRIPDSGESFSGERASLRALGCSHGCWASDRSPMGDV